MNEHKLEWMEEKKAGMNDWSNYIILIMFYINDQTSSLHSFIRFKVLVETWETSPCGWLSPQQWSRWLGKKTNY